MRRQLLQQAPSLTGLLQRKKMSSAAQSGGSSNGPHPRPRLNPFQKTGTETQYERKETKEKFIVRVDIPGCPESDLTCWVDSDTVNFFAEEPPDAKLDHAGRKYGGAFVMMKPELYNVKETKAKLVNGVLWITVPKHAKKPTT